MIHAWLPYLAVNIKWLNNIITPLRTFSLFSENSMNRLIFQHVLQFTEFTYANIAKRNKAYK